MMSSRGYYLVKKLVDKIIHDGKVIVTSRVFMRPDISMLVEEEI
jgi:hypothetical protein